jgi:hypothetical protein
LLGVCWSVLGRGSHIFLCVAAPCSCGGLTSKDGNRLDSGEVE